MRERLGCAPSAAERAVLELLAAGWTTRATARRLCLTPSGLTMRLHRLRERCGCGTLYQLLLLVGMRGWAPVQAGKQEVTRRCEGN